MFTSCGIDHNEELTQVDTTIANISPGLGKIQYYILRSREPAIVGLHEVMVTKLETKNQLAAT